MFAVTRFRPAIPVMNPIRRIGARRNIKTITTKTMTKNSEKTNKWTSFRAIFTRWVPLTSVVYVGWCYFRGTSQIGVSKIEVKFYELFPFRVTSRLWGKLASVELPIPLRGIVYGTYIKMFKVNLDDAAIPDLNYYKSLSDFFTRPLKDGVRVISNEACVSPCDGVVLNCGPVMSDKIEQVKGVTYSIENFLGENVWNIGTSENYYQSLLKNKNNVLYNCIIYLAPGDYHRFHSPCDWHVKFRRHFSGKLLSVNPWVAKVIPGLFCLNERAVYIGDWKHGFFSLTAVGATNVGSIEIFSDKDLKTNQRRKKDYNELCLDIEQKKGQLFGQFNMGSTILLLFEAPKDYKFGLCTGDRVQVGEGLTKIGLGRNHTRS